MDILWPMHKRTPAVVACVVGEVPEDECEPREVGSISASGQLIIRNLKVGGSLAN